MFCRSQQLKLKLIVCSTNEQVWLFKNTKRKTDRDDALKLARLAMMNELLPTQVPSKTVREKRRLIKFRKKVVERINGVKCGIRAVFANQGIQISFGAKTWHSGRPFLIQNAKPLEQCADIVGSVHRAAANKLNNERACLYAVPDLGAFSVDYGICSVDFAARLTNQTVENAIILGE